jgi:hypothetical protein
MPWFFVVVLRSSAARAALDLTDAATLKASA